MNIIIYRSQYGLQNNMQKILSRKTNIKVESYENIKSIDEYENNYIYSGLCTLVEF